MLRKLTTLLIATILSAAVFAAPTEQEARLCQMQGIAAYEAATARVRGMTKQEFEAAIAKIVADSDVPEPAKTKGISALRQGFASKKAPEVIGQEVYDSCMEQKQI